ncbi:Histidine ammonia-lyase [Cupriavidus basilensis OR16]|uniref:Histidine ammonia-lyase n=1 Tax=Cupriavidus basilensis OR16 TaxID=1127483 RepID=H1S7V7_9BURK|nr:tyrosine 2,3-aminomutase [Cupriavidus basilensis]EHP41521.1 Histidine ammonia-lyase [Cupriavidus basilensis OR16]
MNEVSRQYASSRQHGAAVEVDGQQLTAAALALVAQGLRPASLDEAARAHVADARARFEASNIPIYGVSTGFGELVHNWVDICAATAPAWALFGREEVRAMMVARANALARGYSAVRPLVIEQLLRYLDAGITPAVPQVGSLGASGDLAPLSHIAITLIGEGKVLLADGTTAPTAQVLREHGIEPIKLSHKEGLALINGTSAMTGVACLLLETMRAQVTQAEIIAALALEGLNASADAFMTHGHDIAKPHPGQVQSAANLRALLAGSTRLSGHGQLAGEMKTRAGDEKNTGTGVFIQKAYTLRCIPQVLGAVRDTLGHCATVVERELNSSNDNPLFFDDGELFHGGNFHGQQVAFAMDFLAIAATQLGVVSERRLNRLLSPHLNNGLPAFLAAANEGLSCGFAGAQYPATALIAENRTICSPASIQSVPSNGDNQDVVSMGLIGARNARRIIDNNQYILAVELLAACQAAELAGAVDSLSSAGRAVFAFVRERVPFLAMDRYMTDDIEAIAAQLRAGALVAVARAAGAAVS